MLPGFLLHQSYGNRADSGRFRRALTQQYYVGELVNDERVAEALERGIVVIVRRPA